MMKVGNHGQNETVDRAMSHTVRHKKMLLTRLKKIQGQEFRVRENAQSRA